MPTHDAEWRRKVSEAQKRRWERHKATGQAADTARKISEKLRRVGDDDAKRAVQEMSEAGGPTLTAMAQALGVSGHSLRQALRRHLGKGEARVLIGARKSDSMKGNNRSEGRTHPPEVIEKMRAIKLGENNPNWRGGHRTNRPQLSNTRWRKFRDRVLERDQGVCQCCGATGPILCLHHKIPERVRPDLLWDENNCTTLCSRCHKAADDEWRGHERVQD